ncbi:hypothetical protein CBR_g32435 [Chara braunii]|uniref:Uncharacterized protein n=1 Tax=Chara braunii TaxID=69332 RepID=A0A388JYK4_CHABU|nr:hypothetical protein CBR_g32435 [Chara braunii]|eukprot:GBG62852.1 hypothetical protein CBR_g32435 [Chara braunii]
MEKRELIKQAKKLALLEEAAAKKRQTEEELEKWKKEHEEKLAAVKPEVEGEEEEVEAEALVRRRGEASSSSAPPEEVEKVIKEWVATLSLGEDKEAELMVPQAEREAVTESWKKRVILCGDKQRSKRRNWSGNCT